MSLQTAYPDTSPVVQPTRRRTTIVEVAERANVAFSTVSRVLNGGYASPQVRERVQEAARELSYTPSSIARNLKTGRQGCIGVVVESSQCSWFTQVLGGIEETLAEKTVSALLGSLYLRGRYDPAVMERWIAERRVDGLIFARCTRHEEGLVEHARKAHIPMVFVAPDENFGAGPVFVARNREAARTLAEHLMDLGHRRFGFLGGPEKSVDALERLRGLEEGLAARKLAIAPAHVQLRREPPEAGRQPLRRGLGGDAARGGPHRRHVRERHAWRSNFCAPSCKRACASRMSCRSSASTACRKARSTGRG